MELTINIKEQQKIALFIKLLQGIDYVELINIKEDETPFSSEHKELLEKRLNRIENGVTKFKSLEIIKQKYNNNSKL